MTKEERVKLSVLADRCEDAVDMLVQVQVVLDSFIEWSEEVSPFKQVAWHIDEKTGMPVFDEKGAEDE